MIASRRCLAIACALALLGGCSVLAIRPTPTPATATQPPSCRSNVWWALDGVGAAVLGLLAAGVKGLNRGNNDDTTHYYIAGGAGVLAASAVYGIAATTVCNGRADEMSSTLPETREATPLQSRTAARQLHLRATEAARTGDCTVAQANDAQIRELDADYHAVVFWRDVAIRRCLAPAQ